MTDGRLTFLRCVQTVAVLLSGMIGLAGCSSVPDAINPVEWYHGVEGMFESEEDQQTRSQVKTAKETAPPLPGTDRPYPNLSTVPERPRSVSTPEERNRVTQGLAADRDNARYSEPDPDRPSGSDVGAPTAAPRVPVTRQQAPIPPSGPSMEGLEPLPIEPQPTAPNPGPRTEAEEPAPAPMAEDDSVPAPMAENDSVPAEEPSVQQAAYEPPAAPPQAAPRHAAPMATAPAGIQRAQAIVEATPMPVQRAQATVTSDGPKTTAGTPIPGSFLVHFTGGSAHIDSADLILLRDVATLYKSTGGTLRIIGHASGGARSKDPVNQRITNFRISSQRAEAVANELARLGVPREAMAVSAVSDNEPIYDESQPRGESGNRRVEIFFDP